MEQEYIQVKPSRESLSPDDIVSHFSSLHKLTEGAESSLGDKINPLKDSSEDVPQFEFIALTEGKDAPVEFYYGVDEKHRNNLKSRLTTAYPSSFDIDIVEIDLLKKTIPPKKYTPKDFVKRMEGGKMLFDPNATGTHEDISTGNSDKISSDDEGDGDDISGELNEDEYIPVDRASETTEATVETAITSEGETKRLSPEDIEGYDMLEELNAGLLDLVELPEEFDATHLEIHTDKPTWTEDGEILARPTLEHGEPIAVRWSGEGERKQDWMTTLKKFSNVTEPQSDDIDERAPLATLVQHLADSDLPIAFQVVFKRVDNWSKAGEKRKENIHLNRDTLGQKITYELGELMFGPSKERRRERRRDHMDKMGESADSNTESAVSGSVGDRRKLIDNKMPNQTFRANIRAVSIATSDESLAKIQTTMEDLSTVLDHLDGYFYGLSSDILRDGEGGYFDSNEEATEEFHRFINREITTGNGEKRPDIIANADELANFITVPSSKNLTVEGVRGARAKPESRDPLPKPNPDLMREFHKPGMRIGYALDKEADPEPVPTQVPPGLLTKHYGRFATTGAGKSVSLVNDILSLHENTSGPTILVDPKGDGMSQNYMKAHFERFGEDDLKENVIHYPIPEILPGFTFFNIEPALRQGKRRTDAIQNKADHYQELLKLVMGRDRYEQSKVAPTIISALIKALFDEEYFEELQEEAERRSDGDDEDTEFENPLLNRDSANKFSHRQLEYLTKEYRKYGTKDDEGELPNVSVEPVQDTLEEQAEGTDTRTFTTIMNAVFNRLNYIREDTHLRRIFNNTEPRFDFRNHLSDDKVILFDLGELRDDATMVMTGLILTNIWDSLQEGDQTECTKGHESREACRNYSRKNGLDPSDPPCREPWADDHTVNLIIDEAASVAVSDLITKMLEQGRSFQLSLGLSMQFPEQMKSAGNERVYKNVLNNVATKLIGKITLDEEIAAAMAHENMDTLEFNNRIKALPRGEWIGQLPSPTFMETGPDPMSLRPLPPPAGHPDSSQVLTEEAKQRVSHIIETQVHGYTQQEFGIPDEEMERDDDEDSVSFDDLSDTSEDESDSEGEVSTVSDDQITVGEGMMGGDGDESQSAVDAFMDGFKGEADTPSHVKWDEDEKIYVCKSCRSEYLPQETEEAIQCCFDELLKFKRNNNPADTLRYDTQPGYVTGTQKVEPHRGIEGTSTQISVTTKKDGGSDNEPAINTNVTISSPKDLIKPLDPGLKDGLLDEHDYAPIISAVIAATPPEYMHRAEYLLNWYGKQLQNDGNIDQSSSLSKGDLRSLVYSTPPAQIDIDAYELLNQTHKSDVARSAFTEWNSNGLPMQFKRFTSGRVPVQDTNTKRTGHIGKAYSDSVGLSKPVDIDIVSATTFALPDPIDPDSVDITGKKNLPEEHLDEYDITQSEAGFMADCVRAANRDLPGYDLLDSMKSTIGSEYDDVDVDKLIDKEYVEEINESRGVYYQITQDGVNACGEQYISGIGIGDSNDGVAHRLGGRLAEAYYETKPDVNRTALFDQPVSGGTEKLDVQGINENGNAVYVGEIESNYSGNYDAIAEDAKMMAKRSATAHWFVRNKELATHVLNVLRDRDIVTSISKNDVDNFKDSNLTYEDINERLREEDGNGIDKLIPYSTLRDGINNE